MCSIEGVRWLTYKTANLACRSSKYKKCGRLKRPTLERTSHVQWPQLRSYSTIQRGLATRWTPCKQSTTALRQSQPVTPSQQHIAVTGMYIVTCGSTRHSTGVSQCGFPHGAAILPGSLIAFQAPPCECLNGWRHLLGESRWVTALARCAVSLSEYLIFLFGTVFKHLLTNAVTEIVRLLWCV